MDDDPNVRKIFSLLIEFDGHEVQAVDNGEAALARLEQNEFDLIITDYLMPGMKGDQLAALIKQRRPDQPVIMASGSFADSNFDGSSIAGVDCLLNKPFSMTELREAINWVLAVYADSQKGRLETGETQGSCLAESDDNAKRTPDDRRTS